MSYKVLIRYRLVKKNVLIIQKRSINIFTVIPYMISQILLFLPSMFSKQKSTIPEWIVSDWTEYNNIVYKKDEELNFHAKEIRRIIDQRDALEKVITDEIKTIDNDLYQNKGYSEWFEADSENFKPIGLNFIKPVQEWKKILNPRIYGEGRKTASGKDKSFQPSDNTNETTTYTLSDYDNYSISMKDASFDSGADNLIFYKESQKKGGGDGENKQNKNRQQGGGGFNPRNRKKQRGESPEGHEERLQSIQDGIDVSNWIPY